MFLLAWGLIFSRKASNKPCVGKSAILRSSLFLCHHRMGCRDSRVSFFLVMAVEPRTWRMLGKCWTMSYLPSCCFVVPEKWNNRKIPTHLSTVRNDVAQGRTNVRRRLHSESSSKREELGWGAEQITGTQPVYPWTRRVQGVCRHRCWVWSLGGWENTLVYNLVYLLRQLQRKIMIAGLRYSEVWKMASFVCGIVDILMIFILCFDPSNTQTRAGSFPCGSACKRPPFWLLWREILTSLASWGSSVSYLDLFAPLKKIVAW